MKRSNNVLYKLGDLHVVKMTKIIRVTGRGVIHDLAINSLFH